MNWRIRHFDLAILITLIWWVFAQLPLAAQTATEDQLKAAYIFNFAKFVEWPADLFTSADAPMNFCILGRGGVADEMDSVRGKSVNGHMINVRHLRGPEEVKDCNLVFMSASSAKNQQRLLLAATGLPILLVAETPGFARAGGTINFIREDSRLLFEVNVNAADRTHLKISSKLLTQARIVLTAEEKQRQ